MGRAWAWGTWLVPAHWWVEPCPGVFVCKALQILVLLFLWLAGPSPRAVVGSVSLKVASLLEGGTVSPPNLLLVLA